MIQWGETIWFMRMIQLLNAQKSVSEMFIFWRDAIANWTRVMVDLGIYAIPSRKQTKELLKAESTIVLGFLTL